MATFKYIIVTATAFRTDKISAVSVVYIPLIFGHFFSHGDIAQSARSLARHGQFRLENINIYSAGFVEIGHGEIVCYGESETLKMKPREGDAEHIKNFRMAWDWDINRNSRPV